VERLDDTKHRPRIRRPSAKASRDGQVLLQLNAKALRAREGVQRAGDEVVEGVVKHARKLAPRGDAVLRGPLRRQHIARIDEGEQGLKLVIPVLPPPADMQREVDLGIGGFGDRQISILRHCEEPQATRQSMTGDPLIRARPVDCFAPLAMTKA
jgi:hypothetical protein